MAAARGIDKPPRALNAALFDDAEYVSEKEPAPVLELPLVETEY